jgi:hypothetical protein
MEDHEPNQPFAQQMYEGEELCECVLRHDTTGPWNLFKAYWLFVVHLLASVLFVTAMMEWIDAHNFRPGTPPSSFFELDGPLFQTQVNGLVSLALVLVRLLAACCTAPLIWTMILILLDNRGMTLLEISRLSNYQIPMLPRAKTAAQAIWLGWATLVILLLWPSNFAAPLANSSLAWNPLAQDLGAPTPISLPIGTDDPDGNFWALRMPEWQMNSFLRTVVWTGSSPEYANVSIGMPMRRYFSRPANMTSNSTASISLPYFDVQVRWIDASSDPHSKNINDTTYSDYVGPRSNGVSRTYGSVTVTMNEPWVRTDDYPKDASKLVEQRLIGVKVNGYSSGDRYPNGTSITSCPRTSPYFPSLPDLEAYTKEYSVDSSGWGRDCYQVGIATIQAGLFHGTDCEIRLVGSSDASATCYTQRDFTKADKDWVSPIATNMLSEVAKAAVTLGYATPSNKTSLDDYVTNVLTLSYHAAWSAAIDLVQVRENGTYKRATPMVRASVDKGKLLGWLAMQLTVTIAAGLVYAALQFSTVKFVRDTTLTPLRLDLSQVTHHPRTSGLCNAVALNKKDRRLPMLRFGSNVSAKLGEDTGKLSDVCRMRVVFADEAES